MKRRFSLVILLMTVLFGLILPVHAQDDMDTHRSCAGCGMDRKSYGYSRMLIVYETDETGLCSLHCAVLELEQEKGRVVKSILVADRETRALIAAEQAVWVMGGKKRGVMTRRPKWAFADQAAASAFIKANGGTLITWDEALSAAREDAGLPVVPKQTAQGG